MWNPTYYLIIFCCCCFYFLGLLRNTFVSYLISYETLLKFSVLLLSFLYCMMFLYINKRERPNTFLRTHRVGDSQIHKTSFRQAQIKTHTRERQRAKEMEKKKIQVRTSWLSNKTRMTCFDFLSLCGTNALLVILSSLTNTNWCIWCLVWRSFYM